MNVNELHVHRLSAIGTAIGSQPFPYRLDYRLETRTRFLTSLLAIEARGEGWRRWLKLRRRASGEWTAELGSEGESSLPDAHFDASEIAGAQDCDLGLSPLTNSMPFLRLGRAGWDAPTDLLMAWVSVPDLGVHASRQRYTFRRAGGSEPDIVRLSRSMMTFAPTSSSTETGSSTITRALRAG